MPRNLPARSFYYIGRRATFLDLRKVVSATHAVTVCGPPGVGKTQLAIDYAIRCQPDDAVVWWLRAGDPVTLALDYAGLAVHLGLAKLDDLERATMATTRYLESQTGWLLVFDDADDLSLLGGYLLPRPCGTVLYLSRGDEAAPGTTRFALSSFARAESIAALRARSGGRGSDELLSALAEELSDHPLAIAMIGAILARENSPIDALLGLVRDERERGPSLSPAQLALSAILCLVDALSKDQPLMRPLMHLFSLCGGPPLPTLVFSPTLLERARDFGDPEGKDRATDPLAALAEMLSNQEEVGHAVVSLWLCGLNGLDAGSVGAGIRTIEAPRHLHELWLSHHRQQGLWPFGIAVANLLHFVFHSTKQEDVDDWTGVLPNLCLTISRAAQGPGPIADVGLVAYWLGEWLTGKQAYRAALSLLQRGLPLLVDDDEPDPKGRRLAQSRALVKMAICHKGLRDHEASSKYAAQALSLMDDGASSPLEVANAEHVLGVALLMQGDAAGAEGHIARAEALMRPTFYKEPGYAGCLLNLGIVQMGVDKKQAAERSFRRALQVYSDAGVTDERLGRVQHFLGRTLYGQGKKNEARRAFERSLALHERLGQGDDALVGGDLLYLSTLLRERGELSTADKYARRGIKIVLSGGPMDAQVVEHFLAARGAVEKGPKGEQDEATGATEAFGLGLLGGRDEAQGIRF